MEKELERLISELSPEEAEGFEASFESFGESDVSADEQSRILSSVMRKAGFEMKENTNLKRRHPKRMIGFIIAAALALTGAIGAYAYNQFVNRKSVEMYLNNVEALEKGGYAVNQVVENEHLRITVDTVISDGYNAYIIETKEALDSTGHDYLNNGYFINTASRYADTGEYINLHGGCLGSLDTDDNDTYRQYSVYDLRQTDTDREVDMIFYAVDLTQSSGYLDEHNIPVDNPFGYDMVITLDLSKNCEIKTLTSADGAQIRLSQFEIICEDADVTYEYGDSLHLIKKNGKYEEIDWTNLTAVNYTGGSTKKPDFITLDKFIDLDKYSGVEINGVEYTVD